MAAVEVNRIRIVMLTPHPLVSLGLRHLIAGQDDIQIVGESDVLMAGLDIVARQKPDIVLLELNQGCPPGLEIISELVKAWRRARIILLTSTRDDLFYMKAIQEGVIGVVFMTQSTDLLIKAIHKVNDGEAWIDHSMVAALLVNLKNNQFSAVPNLEVEQFSQLNSREQEIVKLIGQGLKTKQIADRLFISQTTVRHYLTKIYSKLGVKDRLELLVLAHRLGITDLS